MDELIDILDSNGQRTGKSCLKSEAHRLGLFHPTVHIWLFNNEQEILFQKRGSDKETFPNLWDVSVAGHIAYGESYIDAALREVKEEVGILLQSNNLIKLGQRRSEVKHANGILDVELHHIYVSRINQSIEALYPQQEEVAALKFLPIEHFKAMLTQQDQMKEFVPMQDDYYSWVVEHIEAHL